MIARMYIPILLMIVLSDLYIDIHYLRRKFHLGGGRRLLWWLPCIGMVAYTVGLASVQNFVPDNLMWVEVYLMLLGIFVVPKAVFTICSVIGLGVCHLTHRRNNWGNIVGLFLSIVLVLMFVYSLTFGVRQLSVKHIDLYVEKLPQAFEGYRIVHFSDAHVGMFEGGKASLLARDIDSIKAQKADLVAFTGDLQNIQPSELRPFIGMLRSIKAPDGVYSVLGNHDYSEYIQADGAVKRANEKELIARQRQCGWRLLLNEHAVVYRGQDSIVIAGTENDGRAPFPQHADYIKALYGVGKKAFVVMLQHDPSAWDRHILPLTSARLTLSGHTHAGQVSLLGFRPTRLAYAQDYGLYEQAGRYLYVTAGLGGVVPFRFGASAEIAVITLHRLESSKKESSHH
uniref:Metallophosphoesterase n=1 Tax=Prevotella sp. GTC17262 TaxID=3236797 RepID=A0AB33JDP2_9BACT